MIRIAIICLALLLLTSCVKYVPCPKTNVPNEPTYPVLVQTSTPKEVLEYCRDKTLMQEGYIKELQKLLK